MEIWSGARSFRSAQPFVGDDHLLGGDLVAAGVELGAGPLGDPALVEVPAADLGLHRVLDDDRAVATGAVDVAVLDLLAPLPEGRRLVDPAFQGDVAPLHRAGNLPDDHLPFLGGL